MKDDLIRRSDALNCSHIVYIEFLEIDDGGYIEGDADCIPVVKKRDIESIPAVDAVEVVRCGECVHCNYDTLYGERWCDGRRVKPNHFCGYGKRKADLSLQTDNTED